MLGAPREGALECIRDGDLVRFHPRTCEFEVLASGGYIRTFMVIRQLPNDRQTPLRYFQSK
jgi:hypothetical protein